MEDLKTKVGFYAKIMADLSDFTTQKIKTELKRRGLFTKGKRDSLEQRLASALEKEKTEDTEVEEIPVTGSEETVCTKKTCFRPC